MSASTAASSQVPHGVCRVRITNITDGMTKHSSDNIYLDSRAPFSVTNRLRSTPVIRIFGSTDSNQKACLHVHNVFPYLFVPYEGDLTPDAVSVYIQRFAAALDYAVALAVNRNAHESEFSGQQIRAVILCKGVPIYGFHVGWRYWLKILYVNPRHRTRIQQILESGGVLGTRYQAYEAHIPYVLQFLADFNLFGCGWIELDACKFRLPLPEPMFDSDLQLQDTAPTTTISTTPWTTASTPFHLQHEVSRESRCVLELDASAWSIINRRRVEPRTLHSDFTEWFNPLSEDIRRVPSLRAYWDDESRRRQERGESAEVPPVESLTGGRTGQGTWYAEDKLRTEIKRRMDVEKQRGWANKSFSDFVSRTYEAQEDDRLVLTSYESTEALWPRRNWYFRKSTSEVMLPEPTPVKPEVNLSVIDSILTQRADPNFQDEDDMDFPDYIDFEPGTPSRPSEPFSRTPTGPETPSKTNPFASDAIKFKGFTPRKSSPLKFVSPAKTQSASKAVKSRLRADVPLEPTLVDTVVDPFIENTLNSPRPSAGLTQFTPKAAETAAFSSPQARPRPSVPRRLHPSRLHATQNSTTSSPFWTLSAPPSRSYVASSINPHTIHQVPYYSNREDLTRDKVYGGRVFNFKTLGVASLPEFATAVLPNLDISIQTTPMSRYWEFVGHLPKRNEIIATVANVQKVSQMINPSDHLPEPMYDSYTAPRQHMGTLAIEVHINCRPSKRSQTLYYKPDPMTDEIQAVTFCYHNEDGLEDTVGIPGYHAGYILVKSDQTNNLKLRNCLYVDDELELIHQLIDLVRRWDPECLAGWEVQRASWGYVQARAATYEFAFNEELARLIEPPHIAMRQYEATHHSAFNVVGRHVMNIWRIMRGELALTSYTFENVVQNVLRIRKPHFSEATLTQWYQSTPSFTTRVLEYWLDRVVLDIQILEDAEIITRNAEFARCFGIDFYSVISRGSQFKVESFLVRMAKPESYVIISPSKEQVGSQNAAECIALIMEPQSALYTDPVLVLDFQSLYPSCMIAYNYSFDTCLGRVFPYNGVEKFGVTQLPLDPGLISLLGDHVNVSPNGLMFVKPEVRKGVIRKNLIEILETRVMIKQSMKAVRHDKLVTRMLNARQLSLKFVANVTYGYVGASYSGRMPCVEIADAIVQTGKETLEKAIQMIHERQSWDARVVYGDTDSLFVHLPGRSKAEAFRIGNEIAEAVTAANPHPVRLKFEKVYLPCVLMAKKRYVGNKYEYVDEEPVFDAKGIETVRRDGSGIERKMLEVTLKKLFKKCDMSEIKAYVQGEFAKIQQNNISIQDCIIAKEVKLGTYAESRLPPPGVMVAAEMMLEDPNAEPQYADRVPYIITKGEGTTQAETSRSPQAFLAKGSDMLIDDAYYCARAVSVLNRVLNLMGVDANLWLNTMPKTFKASRSLILQDKGKKRRIDAHFQNNACLVCGAAAAQELLCPICKSPDKRSLSVSIISTKLANLQNKVSSLHKICATCSQVDASREEIECDSIDCAVLYARHKARLRWGEFQGVEAYIDSIDQKPARSRR